MGKDTSRSSFGLVQGRQCSFASGGGGCSVGGGARGAGGTANSYGLLQTRKHFFVFFTDILLRNYTILLALFLTFCVCVFHNRPEVKEPLKSAVSATE